MKQSSISLRDFNLGGIADSKYQGIKNSMYSMVGFNIHDEPGILKVNQALVKESGSTVDEFVKIMVPCSDGNTYIFGGTTGKIWKRTSGGAYSLVHTDANGAIYGAEEYEGYLYWATQSKLGRWQIGAAWAGANDNYATFTNGDTMHPMKVKNGVLYIGDKNVIAQVDAYAGTPFSATALTLPKEYHVKSLGEVVSDLLIGTYVSNNVNKTKIFRWNTWSVSFTNEDTIPEVGVNTFLSMDNSIVVNVGTKGNLYTYDGQNLNQFKRIPGSWSGSNQAFVHTFAVGNYLGLPLFGLSNISGNPALQGVYSFGSYSSNYPKVLNLEYVISQNKTSNIEITAIAVVGDDILVAWKDGSTYGVDKVDWNNKYNGAYMETREISIARNLGKAFSVNIQYRSVPTNTGITLWKSVNYGAYEQVTLVQDDTRKLYYTKVNLTEVQILQLKFVASVSGNNAPEIEGIEISY